MANADLESVLTGKAQSCLIDLDSLPIHCGSHLPGH